MCCRRAKNEYLRSELQNAEQQRGSGMRLKQGPLDPYGLSLEEWTQLAGQGRSRSAVAASTIAALNVRPVSSAVLYASRCRHLSTVRLRLQQPTWLLA